MSRFQAVAFDRLGPQPILATFHVCSLYQVWIRLHQICHSICLFDWSMIMSTYCHCRIANVESCEHAWFDVLTPVVSSDIQWAMIWEPEGFERIDGMFFLLEIETPSFAWRCLTPLVEDQAEKRLREYTGRCIYDKDEGTSFLSLPQFLPAHLSPVPLPNCSRQLSLPGLPSPLSKSCGCLLRCMRSKGPLAWAW